MLTISTSRLTLESSWQRKIDEVIALSKAIYGLAPDDDGSPAGPRIRASGRLHARTERSYDDLAAIEDAIARIDEGMYGMCEGCGLAMPDEWLAAKPQVRYCPDCSLRRAP
jgi:DnaK suppressor protein